ADDKPAGVEASDTDAERAEHLAVQRGRADEAARAGAVQHDPEGQRDGRAEQQDEQVVVGQARAEELDRARQAGRPRDRELARAPELLGHVAQDQDEGVGEEELYQLLFTYALVLILGDVKRSWYSSSFA